MEQRQTIHRVHIDSWKDNLLPLKERKLPVRAMISLGNAAILTVRHQSMSLEAGVFSSGSNMIRLGEGGCDPLLRCHPVCGSIRQKQNKKDLCQIFMNLSMTFFFLPHQTLIFR